MIGFSLPVDAYGEPVALEKPDIEALTTALLLFGPLLLLERCSEGFVDERQFVRHVHVHQDTAPAVFFLLVAVPGRQWGELSKCVFEAAVLVDVVLEVTTDIEDLGPHLVLDGLTDRAQPMSTPTCLLRAPRTFSMPQGLDAAAYPSPGASAPGRTQK